MKNLLDMIVKELGLEYGEEFKILDEEDDDYDYEYIEAGKCDTFKFDKHGLIDSKHGFHQTTAQCKLMNGQYTIEKLPFKPSYGEKFYYINPMASDGVSTHSAGTTLSKRVLSRVTVYRTREKAITAAKKEWSDLRNVWNDDDDDLSPSF